ncbi:hypothetical protein [Encephalitozoon cuniculi GB-M1]|uniref:Uncharacterized protein n=1 Tax=Encephalitozoon cuniculi (strain GB-M1) TaxID=284813 RepID=Q8SU81_ENCCU|nr:uncharacterized protein ECU11_0290 [Encephalitozoon cuniculi GB-M1]CAD25939.1 hypothetical protein [Encephalitozoon cuniculi GB-M1]
MEQIERVKAILAKINLNCNSGTSLQTQAVKRYKGIILCGCSFYVEVLDSIRDDLLNGSDPEGIAAVDAAEKALQALLDYLGHKTSYLKEEGDDTLLFNQLFGTIPNFFQRIDYLKKNYQKLLQEFKNALEKLLPYVNEDLVTKRDAWIVPKGVPLRVIFSNLLETQKGYSTCVNNRLHTFPERLSNLGLEVFELHFSPALDGASSEYLEEIGRVLIALEKEVGKCNLSKGQEIQLQKILLGIQKTIDSLVQKLRDFRIAYDQAVVDIGENGALFGPKFDELNQMLGKVNKGLPDLRYRIDRLEKILCPSFLGFGFYEFLCIVFIGSLAIFLYLGEEDTTAARSWNTGVYLLAVVGGIAYQAWRLATRYRDDGVIEMLREEWTAAGCIVPMAAALLHGGVIRSSVYSMTVVGIVAAAVCVQGLASRKMPRRQMCMVAGGILGLGALCAAGDRKMLLDSYEWRRWMCAGVVVFAALALLMLYADAPGDEEKTAKGAGEIVFLMSMAVLTGVSLVCGRDYCMVYGKSAGPKYCSF